LLGERAHVAVGSPGRLRVILVDFGMSPACPVRLNLGNADCPVLPVAGIGLDVIQAPKADLESCGSRELPLLIFPAAFCRDPEAQADLPSPVLPGISAFDRISISFCPLAIIQGKVTANKRSAARSGVLVAKSMTSHSPAGGADYRL
jgi:hypothetical protein